MIHFTQMYASKNFQMYDFGSAEKNMQAYNQTTPPLYDVRGIRTPVALYWADEDWLADPVDVQYLRSNLRNIVDDYDIKNWDHLDFIWATDTKPALYDRILNLIKRY
jgi:pimeloyl-ACP methyl ester carboxylesterase